MICRAALVLAAASVVAGPALGQETTGPTVIPGIAPAEPDWTDQLAAEAHSFVADLDAARAEPDAAASAARMAELRAAFRASLDTRIGAALGEIEADMAGRAVDAGEIETRMAGYRERLTARRLAEASEIVFAHASHRDAVWDAVWLAIQGMSWRRRPAVSEADYPLTAIANDAEGWAVVGCRVVESAPVDCVVEQESAAELGFGDAALRVVRRARVNHLLETEGGRFRVTIAFRLGG